MLYGVNCPNCKHCELVHDLDVVGLVIDTLLGGDVLPGHGALGDHILKEMKLLLGKIKL